MERTTNKSYVAAKKRLHAGQVPTLEYLYI